MKQYIVNAFTARPFQGIPTAVCLVEEEWPSTRWMEKVAKQNNLSITAFLLPKKERYVIRYFVPYNEDEFSVHATLAAAFVILNFVEPQSSSVTFYVQYEDKEIQVFKENGLYSMNLPSYPLEEIAVVDEMEQAFGVRPKKAFLGLDLICIFDELEVDPTYGWTKGFVPNFEKIEALPGRYQVASAYQQIARLPGNFTCFSRCFGVINDEFSEIPVSGSAHCQIGSYWAKELGQEEILAYQDSYYNKIWCKPLENGQVQISGSALPFSIGEIVDLFEEWTL